MILRELPPDHPMRHSVQQIRHAGDQAAALAQHLLEFSRRQMSEARPLDVNRKIHESSAMLQTMLGYNVELALRLKEDVGEAAIDPARLMQILMNLSVNARDAMPHGGRLEISTARTESERFISLTVMDTGEGMTAEVRRHLFEPFFTTKADRGGTGLGLAIVQDIVRQSGGMISVESTPGKGTSFRILLPDKSQ
jgi:signal transduction histidine kinase